MKTNVWLISMLCLLMMVGLPASIQAQDYPTVDVVIDGQYLQSNTPAMIINSRTMVPLRAISENLGAQVEWIPDIRTVNITSDSTTDTVNYETGSEEDLYHALVMYEAAQIRMVSSLEAGINISDADKWNILFTIYSLDRAEQMLLNKEFPAELRNIQLDTLQALAELRSASWMVWQTYNGESNNLEAAKGYLQFLSSIYERRPSVAWYNANVTRLGRLYANFDASSITGSEQEYRDWLTSNMYLIGTLPGV